MTDADAAALMTPKVDQNASTLMGDLLEGQIELGTAVTAEAAENVAGEALAVDPHERRVATVDIAHDERDVIDPIEHRTVGVTHKVAVLGRYPSHAHLLD